MLTWDRVHVAWFTQGLQTSPTCSCTLSRIMHYTNMYSFQDGSKWNLAQSLDDSGWCHCDLWWSCDLSISTDDWGTGRLNCNIGEIDWVKWSWGSYPCLTFENGPSENCTNVYKLKWIRKVEASQERQISIPIQSGSNSLSGPNVYSIWFYFPHSSHSPVAIKDMDFWLVSIPSLSTPPRIMLPSM